MIVRPEMVIGSGEVSRSARCSVDRARGRSVVIGGSERVVNNEEVWAVGRVIRGLGAWARSR